MKNKTFNVIVLILLIVSVAGNILLYSRLKTSTTDNQKLNTTVSEIQASVDNLENQLSDVKNQLSESVIKNEDLQSENESLRSELEQLQSELDFLKSIELLSKTMYATEDGNVYIKPDESSEIKGEIKKEDEVHVTGKTSNDWYRVEWGNGVVYIKASLLSDTKPTSNTNTNNSTSTTNNNSNSNSNNSNSNSSTTTPSQGSNSTTTETQKQVQDILNQMGGGSSNESSGSIGFWGDI